MKRKYLIHKAVDFAAMTVKARKELGVNEVDDLSNLYAAQRKYDGCNGVLILKPNEQVLLSRTGEVVKSCDHIKHAARNAFVEKLARGMSVVVFGEVWRPGVSQAVISGDFRRHDPAPALRFVAFDMVSLDEFEAGLSELPFQLRFTRLSHFLRGAHPTDTLQLCETYNPGTYASATLLCKSLMEQGGYDGAILRAPQGKWVAGSGTTGEIVKVKDAATVPHDLRVVDIEMGKGKYAGMVGALVIKYKDKLVKASGMSDAERKRWAECPWEIVGKIVEVHALGESSTGSLREPRFKQIRHDKEHADFETVE